jgi:homoserine O-acetyltransferase/O-succinyltransferase
MNTVIRVPYAVATVQPMRTTQTPSTVTAVVTTITRPFSSGTHNRSYESMIRSKDTINRRMWKIRSHRDQPNSNSWNRNYISTTSCTRSSTCPRHNCIVQSVPSSSFDREHPHSMTTTGTLFNCNSYSTTTSMRTNDATTSTTTTAATAATATNMADEYSATATMDEMSFGDTCTISNFQLESGSILPSAQVRYRTYGLPAQTTANTSNVIVICHALTGNASIDTWWSTLLGPQKPFDTSKYHIVCCNILGSCYGSTSPISINPMTNEAYGIQFPNVTVQDTVRIQLRCLQEQLHYRSIQCVIGGSFGGMQTLEYALQGNLITGSGSGNNNSNSTNQQQQQQQELSSSSSSLPQTSNYIKSIIPIACNAQHSAWQIAISEIQRQMIYNDPQWSVQKQYHLATNGLQLARQMAMISYRTAMGYSNKFGRASTSNPTPTTDTVSTTATSSPDETTLLEVPQWEVSKYLLYQGEKFVRQRQFDPITYVKLTQQMDTHDICRNRISPTPSTNENNNNEQRVATILSQITIPTLILGIDSDMLYPIHEQKLLARYIPNSEFHTIHSMEGHDGFLIEQVQVGNYIQNFLSSLPE